MKSFKIIILFLFFIFFISGISFAKNLTIVYSGQTHAMLYPCGCPIKQDGGIARRASLIKELRNKYPGLLLLDCGNFTAGGVLDEYAKGTVLDIKRTQVNLLAQQIMKYDAVGIGPDEFNFGVDFFTQNISPVNPVYLSANLVNDRVLPFIIKEVNGIKVGIIGLTNPGLGKKILNLKINPIKDLDSLISRIKKQGTQVVIVLSNLGEEEDLKLISEVQGIDLLFVGSWPKNKETFTKIGSTYLIRPFWQGRQLGKLTLEFKNNLPLNFQIEELRISDTIPDDLEIKKILPRCYADTNCKQKGLIGTCENPGELNANCLFTEPHKINLLVISNRDCRVCNPQRVLDFLRKQFPGINPEYVYPPDPLALKLIKDLKISALPVYALGKEVEQDRNFDNFKKNLELKNGFYWLKPEASGISYLLNRQKRIGELDFFFSISEKGISQLLESVREFNPRLHFLAVKQDNGFQAQKGTSEVEEYLRGVCVNKYWPDKFWDYLIWRSQNLSSPLWENYLSGANLQNIRSCAKGPEGENLLQENIALNKELQIMFGPTYLLDNQQLFSTGVTPDIEELRKIITVREK